MWIDKQQYNRKIQITIVKIMAHISKARQVIFHKTENCDRKY
jgi:hypothetical protein